MPKSFPDVNISFVAVKNYNPHKYRTMNFRQFLEGFDDKAENAWAKMLGYRSRAEFEQDHTQLLAMADWLQEHGYDPYAQLIRCTIIGGFGRDKPEGLDSVPGGCDEFEMTSIARQINAYNFLQLRRVDRGRLQLSDGTNTIQYANGGSGRAYFYDEIGMHRITQFNDAQRRLIAFGVLKRFVYYFLGSVQTSATQRRIRASRRTPTWNPLG